MIPCSTFLWALLALAQPRYEVYAIEYASSSGSVPVSRIAVGAQIPDSVRFSYFVWFVRGDDGRNILVDTGFLPDTSIPRPFLSRHERVDSMLARLSLRPDDVTDVIITHPHYDHIGGLHLFRKATVWMQRSDFVYFVGDAWQKGNSHTGFEKSDVPKIIDANLEGRLQLVDGDSIEILPGIRVFTGSMHTPGSQCLLVDTGLDTVFLASDDCWFYCNLEHFLSIPLTSDRNAYIRQLRRIRSLVADPRVIIPGHDSQVSTRFRAVVPGVFRIR